MKTIHYNRDNTKHDIEFRKFIEIDRNGTFIVGLPYEKGKRIPYGIMEKISIYWRHTSLVRLDTHGKYFV